MSGTDTGTDTGTGTGRGSGIGTGTDIMQKPFTLAASKPGLDNLNDIKISLKHRQFQDLKNGHVTHSSLSLFRCNVKGST